MGRHRTPEEKEEFRRQAAAMRAAGIGTKRIAKQLGIGGALASELLRGMPVPSSLMRPQAKDELREAAVLLRQQGRTYDEIKTELGVSKGSLSLWLRELGHPTPAQRASLAAAQDTLPLDLAVERPTDHDIARELRREGWLLREIAAALGVTPTTAHRWTSDLPVPARAVHGRTPEEVRAMRDAYWAARRPELDALRREVVDGAAARVPRIDDDLLDLLAAVAYWCEGSKSKPWRRSDRLSLINSDPDVIRLWLEWLRRHGVDRDRIGLRVNIHESADVAAATHYWATVTQFDPAHFSRPTMKRHNPKTVRYNTGDAYAGCLVVTVRQSRELYLFIEGLWRGVATGVCRTDAVDAEDTA